MKLEEINALGELSRNELIGRALHLDVKLPDDVVTKSFPTSDALRLLIIEKTIEQELPAQTALSKIGADHFAEAVKVHAHAVEFGREAERLDGEGKFAEAIPKWAIAERHFAVARSATAIAQAGLTAALYESLGEAMQVLGR